MSAGASGAVRAGPGIRGRAPRRPVSLSRSWRIERPPCTCRIATCSAIDAHRCYHQRRQPCQSPRTRPASAKVRVCRSFVLRRRGGGRRPSSAPARSELDIPSLSSPPRPSPAPPPTSETPSAARSGPRSLRLHQPEATLPARSLRRSASLHPELAAPPLPLSPALQHPVHSPRTSSPSAATSQPRPPVHAPASDRSLRCLPHPLPPAARSAVCRRSVRTELRQPRASLPSLS